MVQCGGFLRDGVPFRRALAVGVMVMSGPFGGLPTALADGGIEGGAVEAGLSCTDSGDCFAPTPHCHPESHDCVECLGHRNCATGTCDLETNTCRTCLSDADCPFETPYCDTAQNACVECVTDTNCEHIGVSCTNGQCGFCGDGVCSAHEGLHTGEYYGPGSAVDPGRLRCDEDCASRCPTVDLGSALGESLATLSAEGQLNLFSEDCMGTVPESGPDVSFLWKAPHNGTFMFESADSSMVTLMTAYYGGCSGYLYVCNSGPDTGFELNAGEEVLIVVDTEEANPVGTFMISIHEIENPLGDPPVAEGGAVDETVAALCLDNAAARGEPLCDEGTRCACEHCPRDYDDCGVIPGCQEVRACMVEKGCVGAECYNSGACRGVIDSYEGISGPAFRASSALQSCALTFDCELPCDAADSGTPPVLESDGGQLCSPGREVACSCGDGGKGTRRCAANGAEFGPCECTSEVAEAGPIAVTSRNNDDSGCGCRVGSRPMEGASAWTALGLAAASFMRRRSRRGSPS